MARLLTLLNMMKIRCTPQHYVGDVSIVVYGEAITVIYHRH